MESMQSNRNNISLQEKYNVCRAAIYQLSNSAVLGYFRLFSRRLERVC